MTNTPTTLADWLDYIERQHPASIDMGLERVRAVAAAMGLGAPAKRTIVVGGTNGKGSTVAFIEAIARAAGWKVGAYTSPHLLRYNERVRIDGQDVDDAALVAAFNTIEAVRGEITLTYFEYGTLAALQLFADAGLDLAVLEVGLGGRLDAVNIVDADVAVITTVDIDHAEWLGEDREAIGTEKAGIIRGWKPVILARPIRRRACCAVPTWLAPMRSVVAATISTSRSMPSVGAGAMSACAWNCRPRRWPARSSWPMRVPPSPRCARWTSRCRVRRGPPVSQRHAFPAGCRRSSAMACRSASTSATTRRRRASWRVR